MQTTRFLKGRGKFQHSFPLTVALTHTHDIARSMCWLWTWLRLIIKAKRRSPSVFVNVLNGKKTTTLSNRFESKSLQWKRGRFSGKMSVPIPPSSQGSVSTRTLHRIRSLMPTWYTRRSVGPSILLLVFRLRAVRTRTTTAGLPRHAV